MEPLEKIISFKVYTLHMEAAGRIFMRRFFYALITAVIVIILINLMGQCVVVSQNLINR